MKKHLTFTWSLLAALILMAVSYEQAPASPTVRGPKIPVNKYARKKQRSNVKSHRDRAFHLKFRG
jgi:hypothetical protein